jgi:chromosome segregation ATPase
LALSSIQDMARTLRQKEEEISELRSRLGEKEGEVTRARQAAHAAGMERQEQATAIGELRGELGALRDQLQQKQASVQV